MNSLYTQEILEIYEDKSNFGELKTKTHRAKIKNHTCDDELTIELEIKDNEIIDAKFHGTNCFVSKIASTVLTRKIKGMKTSDVLLLTKKDVDKALGIKVSPARIKCELLPLEAVKQCLK